MKHIPNILSIVRCILTIPFFLALFVPVFQNHWLLFAIFITAALTDWFDGYLARKFSSVSKFGSLIDPIADKILVSSVLVLVLYQNPSTFLALGAMLIIGRELVVSAIREWLPDGLSLPVSYAAKIKTALQLVSLGALLLFPQGFLHSVSIALLLSSAALGIFTMLGYIQQSIDFFRQSNEQ